MAPPTKRPSDAAGTGGGREDKRSRTVGWVPAEAGGDFEQRQQQQQRLTASSTHDNDSGTKLATPTPSNGTSSIQAQIEAAKARAAALIARGAMGSGASAASTSQPRPPPPQARPPPTAPSTSAGLDLAAMKARVAEAKRRTDEMARVGRAATTGIHPLLVSSPAAQSSTSRHMAPKYTSLKANASHAAAAAARSNHVAEKVVEANPYLAAAAAADDEDGTEVVQRSRARRRQLTFNAPGRHIRAAEDARQEAQMEALKRRIEDHARKAGLDAMTAEERALRRPKPPGIEWWDQGLLPSQETYAAVALLDAKGKNKADATAMPLITGEGSPITIYVQHPIPIPAPSDKIKVAPKGVMLTKKEMKKMRRIRRKAEQEDKQDKIKMGLLPPDPPKVKLGNLMRVLTSEAVADPTKVEARVRREVAARKDVHEQTNLDRMLTAEQRKAKLDEEKTKDVAKGVETLVFKIKHLASPSHKFKVRKNATQMGLTGLALFGTDFALVLVEGGPKGIKSYRHLMTNRIDWHDPGRPKAADGLDDLGFAEDVTARGSPSSGSATITSSLTPIEQDDLAQIDWSHNYCRVLFQGPLRERAFMRGFRARPCETDVDAKEALGPRLASYWDLAKREDGALEEVNDM